MTEISRADLDRFFDGVNGLCDGRVDGGKDCAGCPCDVGDGCLLSGIKGLLTEHLKEA
jgi:hypothetical protein